MSRDRRVKYTQMVLNESLLEVLREKPLSRITVKEICDRADINRSTYYAHYDNPHDQIKKLEKTIIAEMSSYLEDLPAKGGDRAENKKEGRTAIKNLLDYMYEKRATLRVLFDRSEDLNLQQEFLIEMGRRSLDERNRMNAIQEKREAKYEYIYKSMGSWGLMLYWLMKDTDVSTEEIADMIMNNVGS